MENPPSGPPPPPTPQGLGSRTELQPPPPRGKGSPPPPQHCLGQEMIQFSEGQMSSAHICPGPPSLPERPLQAGGGGVPIPVDGVWGLGIAVYGGAGGCLPWPVSNARDWCRDRTGAYEQEGTETHNVASAKSSSLVIDLIGNVPSGSSRRNTLNHDEVTTQLDGPHGHGTKFSVQGPPTP